MYRSELWKSAMHARRRRNNLTPPLQEAITRDDQLTIETPSIPTEDPSLEPQTEEVVDNGQTTFDALSLCRSENWPHGRHSSINSHVSQKVSS